MPRTLDLSDIRRRWLLKLGGGIAVAVAGVVLNTSLAAAATPTPTATLPAQPPTSTPVPRSTPATPTPSPVASQTPEPAGKAGADAPSVASQPSPSPSPTPSPSPKPSPAPQALPPTQPGLGPDEGLILKVDLGGGQTTYYFIAQGQRHDMDVQDVQAELKRNPLRPVIPADPQRALAYAEAAPIGGGSAGLLVAQAEGDASPSADGGQAPASPDEQTAAHADPSPTPTPIAAPDTYEVQPGDHLVRIAKRFGVSQDALAAANGIRNPNRIFAGQVLKIPAS